MGCYIQRDFNIFKYLPDTAVIISTKYNPRVRAYILHTEDIQIIDMANAKIGQDFRGCLGNK